MPSSEPIIAIKSKTYMLGASVLSYSKFYAQTECINPIPCKSNFNIAMPFHEKLTQFPDTVFERAYIWTLINHLMWYQSK